MRWLERYLTEGTPRLQPFRGDHAREAIVSAQVDAGVRAESTRLVNDYLARVDRNLGADRERERRRDHERRSSQANLRIEVREL